MADKRIIGVLTVQDGRLVKSYGYAAWRPAGKLRSGLRNLDRWGVDEIVVLDISRRAGLDASVLREIASAKVATPLAYGGGIRSAADVGRLLELGCDRFVLETLLFSNPAEVAAIAAVTGRQALIGSLPLRLADGVVSLWRPEGSPCGPGAFEPLAAWRDALLASPVSEFFVTSVPSQGRAGGFPPALLEGLPWLPAGAVIAHGGLDFELASAALEHPQVAAVAFGNLNHEHELVPSGFRAAAPTNARARLRAIRLP